MSPAMAAGGLLLWINARGGISLQQSYKKNINKVCFVSQICKSADSAVSGMACMWPESLSYIGVQSMRVIPLLWLNNILEIGMQFFGMHVI